MKKLINIIIIFVMSVKCYSQPSLSAFNSTQQSQIKAYIAWAIGDSLKSFLPIDNKTIVAQNGKAISVVNVKEVFDSTGKVATALLKLSTNVSTIQGSYVTKTTTDGLTNRILQVENNGSNYNNRISNLELWKGTTDGKIAEINSKVALIPKKAVSTSTSETKTTTVTELQP